MVLFRTSTFAPKVVKGKLKQETQLHCCTERLRAYLTPGVFCWNLLAVKTRYRQVVFKIKTFMRNVLDSLSAQKAQELELCGACFVGKLEMIPKLCSVEAHLRGEGGRGGGEADRRVGSENVLSFHLQFITYYRYEILFGGSAYPVVRQVSILALNERFWALNTTTTTIIIIIIFMIQDGVSVPLLRPLNCHSERQYNSKITKEEKLKETTLLQLKLTPSTKFLNENSTTHLSHAQANVQNKLTKK